MSSVVGKRAALHRAVGPSLFDAIGGVVGWLERAANAAVSAAAASPPSGLSLVHTDTFTPSPEVGSFVVRVPLNGRVVRLTRVQGPRGSRDDEDAPAGTRGEIKGLSAAAALRLKRSMLSVDGSRVVSSFFIANTVPAGEFGWPEFRVFLRRYRARFERRWPGTPAYWVKELTSTGTPHLHLIVLWLDSPPSLAEFREWNDNAWADVVHSSHPSHRAVACRVDLVRSYVGSASYLSGYLTQRKKIVRDDGEEEEERQSDTGKMWGCISKRFLPIRWETDTMTGSEGVQATRIMRRWRQRKGTFWLHSKSSHDSPRTMGKPTEWRRLRVEKMKRFNGARVSSLGEWLDLFRGHGFRIRRCRPRLFRRIGRKLWDQDEESGKIERRRVEQKKLNGEWVDEIHSACSGWHFIDVHQFGKLVRFVRRDRFAGLTVCERRWAGEEIPF
jgi:hypothetical protein